MRFARGIRTGSPAAVWSPWTGSATIWAACLLSAHSSAPARQPAPAPGDSPWPAAGACGLRNQSGIDGSGAGPGSRGTAAAGASAGVGAGSGAGADTGTGTAADQPFEDWLAASRPGRPPDQGTGRFRAR